MDNLENRPEVYYNDYEIDLKDIIKTLWDNKSFIITLFLIAVFASGIVSFFVLEPQYEARSTLLILPPRYTTSLEVSTLPTDTYKSLAMTQSMKSQIIEELDLRHDDGQVYSPSDLDNMMEIEVQAEPQKDNDNATVPLLVLKVTGSDPELISNIANTWADIFMNATKQIRVSEVQDVADVIQNQFDDTKEKLLDAKQELREFKEEKRLDLHREELHIKKNHLANYKNKLISLRNNLGSEKASYQQLEEEILVLEKDGKWLGDFSSNTSDIDNSLLLKIKNNYLEAQNSLLEFKKEHDISLLKQEIAVKMEELKTYREKIISLSSSLVDRSIEVEKISDLLEKEPERWELKKAVSDDVFWQQILTAEEINILENLQLNNEIVNPIYQKLSTRLTDSRILVESIPEQIKYYEDLVSVREKEINDLNFRLDNWTQELERLNTDVRNYEVLYKNQANTYQDLKNKLVQKQLEIGLLENQVAFYNQEVNSLEEEIKDMQEYIWENEIIQEELMQQVSDIQMTYNNLAKRVEEARITEAQKTSDVKFIARSIPPTKPIGPNKKLNVAIAGVLALMLGVFAVFIKEVMKEDN